MAVVDMRMWMPSTWLEPLRVLDPGLRGQVILSVALLASTVALAVAVPVVLLARSGGHPMSQLWIMAVTVCAYVFLFLLCIWRSWPFYVDLVCLSYGLLAAAVAAAYVGPRAAVIALHLATVYAAAHLGYALAQHRLRTGANRGAVPAVPHPSSLDLEDQERVRALVMLFFTVLCTGLMAVLVMDMVGVDELMTVLYLSAVGCLMHVFFWMCHPQPQWMPDFLLPCVMLCPFLGLVASCLVGVEAGCLVAATFQWLLLLLWTASLAYRAAVNLHPPAAAAAAADER